MNVVDCTVLEILGSPKKIHNHWFLKVKYSAYGREDIAEIMRNTNDFLDVVPGYKFLA